MSSNSQTGIKLKGKVWGSFPISTVATAGEKVCFVNKQFLNQKGKEDGEKLPPSRENQPVSAVRTFFPLL